MIRPLPLLLVTAALTVGSAGHAWAGQTAAALPAPAASLQYNAKIAYGAARITALRAVPGGRIKVGALVKESGRTVWAFDMVQTAARSVTEVVIDATTGEVVSVKRQTLEQQARTAAESAAENQRAR